MAPEKAVAALSRRESPDRERGVRAGVNCHANFLGTSIVTQLSATRQRAVENCVQRRVAGLTAPREVQLDRLSTYVSTTRTISTTMLLLDRLFRRETLTVSRVAERTKARLVTVLDGDVELEVVGVSVQQALSAVARRETLVV
jgi:hypothetical protein